MNSAAQFQLNDVILAIAVCLLVWHSHFTRARFIVLVPCSDELAVHSCTLFACRGKLRNLRACCSTAGVTNFFETASYFLGTD